MSGILTGLASRLKALATQPAPSPPARHGRLSVEQLEERCTPTTSTSFNSSTRTLTVTINGPDDVQVAAIGNGDFAVHDLTTGQLLTPFLSVKNIAVNVNSTGVDGEVSFTNPTGVYSLAGSLSVTGQNSNAAEGVDLSKFIVGGAVTISGSTTFDVTQSGGSIGSLAMTQSGVRGSRLDVNSAEIAGNAGITLGSSTNGVFDMTNAIIAGNLSVKGGGNTTISSSAIDGGTTIIGGSSGSGGFGGGSTVNLTQDTLAGLTIQLPNLQGEAADPNLVGVSGSTVTGNANISEGTSGTDHNEIDLTADVFAGKTTLTQAGPNNQIYFNQGSNKASTFGSTVTVNQTGSENTVGIYGTTYFLTVPSFTARAGYNTVYISAFDGAISWFSFHNYLVHLS
jgi:hypothetical protein